MNQGIDYATHMLIGIKKTGDMTVLAQWPRVPRQVDVDGKIQSAGETYAMFVLCTPTSIIPALIRSVEPCSGAAGELAVTPGALIQIKGDEALLSVSVSTVRYLVERANSDALCL